MLGLESNFLIFATAEGQEGLTFGQWERKRSRFNTGTEREHFSAYSVDSNDKAVADVDQLPFLPFGLHGQAAVSLSC